MFLRLGHVHAHVTPPHSSLSEKVLVPSTRQPKQQEQLHIYAILRKRELANQLHLRTTIDKQALAHVIQALVQSQLQKHTSLSNLNQISKYILDLRVSSSILRK
jgi:hypothetical protein